MVLDTVKKKANTWTLSQSLKPKYKIKDSSWMQTYGVVYGVRETILTSMISREQSNVIVTILGTSAK